MKTLILSIVLILSMTGCASTNDYTINGVEPGDNQMLKVVGTIVVLGVVAKGIANKNCSTPQTIRNSNGQITGSVGNC